LIEDRGREMEGQVLAAEARLNLNSGSSSVRPPPKFTNFEPVSAARRICSSSLRMLQPSRLPSEVEPDTG
jgi:hypothetical protein